MLVGTEVGLTGLLLTIELLVSSLLGTLSDIVAPEVLASGDGPLLREELLRLLLVEVLLLLPFEILFVGTGLSLVLMIIGSLLPPVSMTLVRLLPSFLDLKIRYQ